MLPLKPFVMESPASLEELKSLLATMDERTKLMAGGTDIMPNLKYGLYDIDRIISLRKIKELKGLRINNGELELGTLTTLSEISRLKDIERLLPALSKASRQIASPQIRNMGTLGGNICLDTRCLYFNQSEFWRRALGFCLKKDGACCHVVPAGKRCVAAASNDLATVLLAYDASLTILSPNDTTTLPLDRFYTANGLNNNKLLKNQVVTAVTIHLTKASRGGFFKLRHRESIDFPLLSTAVRFFLDDDHRLISGTLVINALVAKPKVMDLADFKGYAYNSALVDGVAQSAENKSFPQTNIGDDVLWRKQMISYSVKRAFNDALQYAD